ncbi:UDP-glucuronosyltransferase [Aphelenchoides fujianensis]|nr:UDP-glucuronosyltransferase [Aphelenchoides fujianensis]
MKVRALLLFSFLFVLLNVALGMRILCLPAYDTGSHFYSMHELMKRLSAEGHDVHVLNPIFEDNKQAEVGNLSAVHVFVPVESRKGAEFSWEAHMTIDDFMNLYRLKDTGFGEILQLHGPKMDEVMAKQWDLLIVDEIFTPHGYAMAMRLKKDRGIPYMMYATSGMLNPGHMEQRAMGRNPVVKSFMFPEPPKSSDDFFRPSVFRYRFYAALDTLYEIMGFHLVVAKYYMPNIDRFGVVDFSWQKLFKDSSVTFSDSLERLGWPVAEGTDLVNTGAYCKSSEVLTGELKEFVEDPKSNGTIYIAFGTYADWRYAPDHVLNAFANGLQRFSDYRVIMSFNGDRSKMPDLPFIKIVKWAPQTAILNHPKTKVFISHGGLKSIKESVCSKTPLIIMPLFAEQAHNGHMFLALKLGRVLNKFTVSEYDVYNEINEILQNPYYEQKAERTRRILLDRPLPALDTAIFYAERILRTRAPNHRISFKRKGMDLYWYEYLYAEAVVGLLSLILLVK